MTLLPWVLSALACTTDVPSSMPDAMSPQEDAAVAVVDAQAPVDDACPYGSEGCSCRADGSPDFRQRDCGDELVCIPWGRFRPSIADAVQSSSGDTCVRPCVADAACGPDRACRPVGIEQNGEPLLGCVDEVAGMDDFCGASRRSASITLGITLKTAGVMHGCDFGLTCQRFDDHHVEEGVCVVTCIEDLDCPADYPFCIDRGSVGTCSSGLYGWGAACGTRDPTKAGVVDECATSSAGSDLACIGLVEVRSQFGYCMARCGNNGECPLTNPGLASECHANVVCASDCDVAPDDCDGDGAGFGRVCTGFSNSGGPYRVCVDRLGPPLKLARVDRFGNLEIDPDDGDCYSVPFADDPELALRKYRCPEPSYCQVQSDNTPEPFGFCVVGCDRDSETPDAYCAAVMSSTTSVCTGALTSVGVCSTVF